MITNLKTFNEDFNNQIKIFAEFAKNFKAFQDRFDKVLIQKERNFEIRDIALEKDFTEFSLNLQKFSFALYENIQQLRFSCVRLFPKEEILTLKELAAYCLTFNKNIQQFERIFKNLDWQIQELNLNLKWGLVEISRNDFANLEKQFLSLIKEVKKYYV